MRYAGGKGRLWHSIVGLMPPHEVYIETHLGGGAVMRNKRPAALNIGIDLDERVIENARTWRIPNLQLRHGDAESFLQNYAFAGRELVYLDPPYLPETRGNRRYYRHEYSAEDHKRLLRLIATLPCRVMISGYPSALYQEALASWRTRTLVNVTHAGRKPELVWANFDFSADLHDYAPIGADFRERERVRRKAARWTARLSQMPDLERRALISALIATPETDPEFVQRLVRQRGEAAL